MTKLTIVMPVYNEAGTLAEILRRVLAVPLPGLTRELIVVDDDSTDGTRELLQDLPALIGTTEDVEVKVLLQDRNRGKGAALRKGFAEATGEIVLIQDADLEYDPSEYPQLLSPILDGRADVVFGSRFVGGAPHRVLYFWHSLGNKCLTLLSNMLSNVNLTDIECCYKVFRAEILHKLVLREDRFGIEPEITAKVARTGCRIYEVGVSYSGRTYAEGKKISWRDGVAAIWCLLRYNLG